MTEVPPPFAAPQLAPVLQQSMPELVQRLVSRLQADIPEYADIPTDQLAQESEAQLRSVLSVLSGDPGDSSDGPTAYGKTRAEQGVPLDVVLHAYRVAWAELWSGILERARVSGIASPDELLSASTQFFWMADDFAGRMVMSYRSRAIELLLRRENERSATLEGVFSGYLNGAERLWEAAALLELPYEGHFVVVAVEPSAPGQEALPGVKDALLQAGIGSAWRLAPDVEAGIISMRTPQSLSLVVDELRAPRVRVGMSTRFTSLAETPHALHLARLTLASLPSSAPAVGQFDDSPLAALSAASPQTARDVATSVLGEILNLPADDRETLLSTLKAWFDASGSAVNTAERLFCHANTVRYRIRRLETYLRRSLADPRDVADIRAAIIALRVIPHLDRE
jgi:PucR C-terminal helix-turn-helix domain/GGDEF-like domain